MTKVHVMGRTINKDKGTATITLMAGDNPVSVGDKVKIMDFQSNLKSGKITDFVGNENGLPTYVVSDLQFRGAKE